MLNSSFLVCTKVELWDLTIFIAVNGEKIQSRTMTLTLELFSHTTMYLNFMFLDHFLFELLCKTHTHRHGKTHTQTLSSTL